MGVWRPGRGWGARIGALAGGGREVCEEVGVRGEFGEGWAGEGEGLLRGVGGGGRHGSGDQAEEMGCAGAGRLSMNPLRVCR